MATKKDGTRIADNKKAAYNYFFEERFEAGMVLQGWEVKALREGKVQLTDGYVVIRNGELFLIGCQINPLNTASTHVNPDCDPHQEAADAQGPDPRLVGKVEQKGYTLVPSSCTGRPARSSARSRWPRARPNTTSATPSRTAKASARSSGP
jgi:SsrA-binding protein